MKCTLKFRVDVFGANVSVVFTDVDHPKMLAMIRKIEKSHGEDHSEDTYPCEGACFSPDADIYTYYLIFNTQNLSHTLIAHEAEHLKNYILERFGYTIKSGSEELPATLAELIVGRIYKFIEKKHLKLKPI